MNQTMDNPMDKPSRAGSLWRNGYRRIFARMMANSSGQTDVQITARKQKLLTDLHGRILEIGPGTGPNLACYPADVSWLGLEPNTAMHPYLLKEAKRLGKQIEVLTQGAEKIPAADNSMDAVVGTWVLCSVTDLSQSLHEILRVLKPGGRYVFIEHVAAQQHTFLNAFQRAIRPVWMVFGDGCHPDRETWTAIENAGFSQVSYDHFRLNAPVIGPHISGFAVK